MTHPYNPQQPQQHPYQPRPPQRPPYPPQRGQVPPGPQQYGPRPPGPGVPPPARPPKPIYQQPWFIGLAALALLILAVWLTPDREEPTPAPASTAAETTAPAEEASTAARPSTCRAVPTDVATAILDGVPDSDAATEGISLGSASAVPYAGSVRVVATGVELPAKDRYLVAVTWTGSSSGTGVWLVAGIDAPGHTMTVDEAASELTVWPQVEVDADLEEVLACL